MDVELQYYTNFTVIAYPDAFPSPFVSSVDTHSYPSQKNKELIRCSKRVGAMNDEFFQQKNEANHPSRLFL